MEGCIILRFNHNDYQSCYKLYNKNNSEFKNLGIKILGITKNLII